MFNGGCRVVIFAAATVRGVLGQEFHAIEPLIPGGLSEGLGVSGDGRLAVGMGSNADGDIESLRWSALGGTIGLGIPDNVGFSLASDTSFDGTFIAGYNQRQGAGRYSGYRWSEAEGYLDLGDLPGGNRNTLGMAISDDGGAIAGFGNYASDVPEGFVWTATGGIRGVGDLPGGSFFSQASGISGDGRVVVGGSSNEVDWGAFRWTEGDGMVGLGYLPGGAYSHAYDASRDGSVIVGVSSLGEGGAEAFRWTEAGGMAALGELPGGQHLSFGFATSADGSVIVGMSDTGAGVTGVEAFIWDESHGMRKLADALLDYGIDVDGWILERAEGISADGRTIVGYGTSPDGGLRGWVAVIPAPSAALVLAWMRVFARRRRTINNRCQTPSGTPGNRRG